MDNLPRNEGLLERLYWLIRLRGIAVIGVISTVFFIGRTVKIPLPYPLLYSVAATLGAYNLFFLRYLNLIKRRPAYTLDKPASRIANLQISLDLVNLTALLHFSGGVENPFIFYFIFHMIIASILLSRRASFMQATFAGLLFALDRNSTR